MSGTYTVQDIRKMNVDRLYQLMAECQSPGYYQMAVEELQRRFLQDIHSQVVRLSDSSVRLERLTKWLIGLTIALFILTGVLLFRGG